MVEVWEDPLHRQRRPRRVHLVAWGRDYLMDESFGEREWRAWVVHVVGLSPQRLLRLVVGLGVYYNAWWWVGVLGVYYDWWWGGVLGVYRNSWGDWGSCVSGELAWW